MAAQQVPGWYPDPNDDSAEVYWDGDRWHGRRVSATPEATGGGEASKPHDASADHTIEGQLDKVHRWWSELSTAGQAGVLVAIVIAVIIIASVISDLPDWMYTR
ncbi:DUF2510 domain-containing protein [Mycobacterium sp. NPDC049093]